MDFVGVTGLEPATAWSQTRNATNCATPRKYVGMLCSNESRGDRTRTCDSLVPNQERYQLRYTPENFG